MTRTQLVDPADPFAADLPDILQFMQLLWAVVHGIEKTSKRMSTDLGVTGPQRLVLRLIGRHPTATAGEIAEMLELHASTLTGILARLEAGALLRRNADPRDRRRARFTLTSAGKQIDRIRRGTVEAAVVRVLARTAPAELAACIGVLRTLAVELELDR